MRLLLFVAVVVLVSGSEHDVHAELVLARCHAPLRALAPQRGKTAALDSFDPVADG